MADLFGHQTFLFYRIRKYTFFNFDSGLAQAAGPSGHKPSRQDG